MCDARGAALDHQLATPTHSSLPPIALCPAETITANYCGNVIKVQNFLYFFPSLRWGRRPSSPTTNRISRQQVQYTKHETFTFIHYETVKLKNHTMQILLQQLQIQQQQQQYPATIVYPDVAAGAPATAATAATAAALCP